MTLVTPDVDTVHIELEARPHSPSIVRAMLGGIGEAEALDPELLDDLRTAVSEACNNVVIHAYGDGGGPMSVDVRLLEDTIEVDVIDRGSGIRRLRPPSDEHMGVGLSVMAALADRAQFLEREDGGTEVHLSFRDRDRGSARRAARRFAAGEAEARLTGDLVVSLSGMPLLATVLDRVARGSAAVARFPLDRIEVVSSVAEAVGSLATASGDGPITFAITDRSPLLELVIGPFAPGSLDGGSADAIAELRELTEELEVSTAGGAELLRLSVSGASSAATDSR